MSDIVYNRPLNISWVFEGVTPPVVDSLNSKLRWEITTDRENETYTSKLRIDSVKLRDAGRYVCEIHNGKPQYGLKPDAFVNIICESEYIIRLTI